MDGDDWNRLSDDDLVLRMQGGQAEEAMVHFQKRYRRSVGRLLCGIVRDEWLAQDLVQEVFVKLFCKSHLYQRGTNFCAWLHGMARNQGLSALRRRRLQLTSMSDLSAAQEGDPQAIAMWDDPLHGMEDAEFASAFDSAVAALPELYRRIFERCIVGGETYRAVAEDMGIPAGTVAIRISRARRRLFEVLGQFVDEPRVLPACVM